MNHRTCTIDGRECFISDSVQSQYILIQTLGNHERGIFDRTAQLISDACGVPFVLAAFQVFDWDLDLTPWHDDAINRKPEVGTKTGDTLRYVTGSLLPALETEYGKLPVILGGYSLGGLFALWSSMQTDRFAAIAAASPSLWIKDWLDYAKGNPVQAGKVYLSLGDREEHVKNCAIARVVGLESRESFPGRRQKTGGRFLMVHQRIGGQVKDIYTFKFWKHKYGPELLRPTRIWRYSSPIP